jgi:hypothetical protein
MGFYENQACRAIDVMLGSKAFGREFGAAWACTATRSSRLAPAPACTTRLR